MIEVEFLSIIITLLGGFCTSIVFLWDIRRKTCENSERITKLEAQQERLEIRVDAEFAKCDLHCKNRMGLSE